MTLIEVNGTDLALRSPSEVRPTVLNFSEPMKTLEGLVLQGKLWHDGGPVLT
jgi:hypothetical protein